MITIKREDKKWGSRKEKRSTDERQSKRVREKYEKV